MTKAETTTKVKHPHPIMQLGTPSLDIESEHIMQFMVFRMGGSNPIHVRNIPRDVTDPLYIKKHVGGGRYQIKAQAEGATSGKPHGCVLGATIYEWDGAPILDSPPASPYAGSAAPVPQQSFLEQAATQGPAIVGALGTALGGIMQIINSGREAREREERSRREYEEMRRREEREERDRKEALMRQETEERREAERRRDEERRDKERAEAEERRSERERIEQARLEQARAEAQARAARETAMMNMLFQRQDPNTTIMSVLLERALNPPPPPPPPNPTASVDTVLDAAKKLKEFTDGDSDQQMVIAGLQALASPGGSKLIDMAASFLGKRPPPEPEVEPVVTPEPPPVAQIPEQATPPMPPPPPEQQVIVPGPVTIN